MLRSSIIGLQLNINQKITFNNNKVLGFGRFGVVPIRHLSFGN